MEAEKVEEMQSAAQPPVPAVNGDGDESEEHGEAPRGALAFVMLMLAFYIVYWFLHWYEIFVARGA